MTHYAIPRHQAQDFEQWCGDNGIPIQRAPWNVPTFIDSPAGSHIGSWMAAYRVVADDQQKTLLRLSWDDLDTITEQTVYFLDMTHEQNLKMVQDVLALMGAK